MRKTTLTAAVIVSISTGLMAFAASSTGSTALAMSKGNGPTMATSKTYQANTEGQNLASLFDNLTRNTKWQQKEKIDLQFNNYHSQGLVRVGNLFYMSAVQVTQTPVKYDHPQGGYDRTPGKGIGHLFVFDKQGKLIKDIRLGEGDIYHPGGLDFDGKNIWVPVAQYRPNSESIVYKVDPQAMTATVAFRVHDHIGGLVRDGQNGKIIGNSWGSRKFYEWNEKGQQLLVKENASFYVDYQDGHYVGQGKMILSGVTEFPNPAAGNAKPFELGGLALVDMKTLNTIREVPVTELSPQGHVITRNPVFLEKAGQEMRLYAVPDDDHGSLLVYETNNLSNKQ
ncbi:DUF6454 family protein [Aneurinibacillus sp. Ricciae_BoGa-3]|uniref:DUF6454 family protein n=1 Tax=Aneurinibacillus sp. Ricciae_BoGa-3 TaxID=3022697 RepID=UPI0023408189|nr:DUF6454 family protein [Aneurinibacillus sp. Ricciae_BoGa-3]WCK53407.1 DUF6454 family protein [Aneurinibacillus sp. Ricciae_BoGa-3]